MSALNMQDALLAFTPAAPEENPEAPTTERVKLTRAVRGQVRRATTRVLTVERREFASSSSPGKHYIAVILQDGKTMCDCRGWTIKKAGKPRQCTHTKQLIDARPTTDDGEYLYLRSVREETQ